MKRTAWFIAGGGVLAALVYAQLGRPTIDNFTRNDYGQSLIQTYQAIQDDYLETLSADQLNKVIEGGISGMIGALNSEFSSYSSPAEASDNDADRRGEFYGIGAVLGPDKDGKGAVILQLMRGLPAITAGIQLGDSIVEVNGESVRSLSVSQIVNKIRGPKDTRVTLGVKRGGSEVTVKYEMTRNKVEILSVTKAMLPGNIGYVTLDTFVSDKVNDQLQAAINDLKAKGAQKLIFDLRDNGGGQLQQACSVASDFIKDGPIVFTRNRTQTKLYCEADGKPLWTGPLVVLINRNSASASEIVSGAIQDTKRGKVIGETSFGKGVGQYVRPLANNGDLTLVTFEWLTPNKRGIHKKGIEPDVKVKDARIEVPLAFEGTGAKPGDTATVTIGGKTYTAKANDQGKFSFSQPFTPRTIPAERGQAIVDLEKDAILKRAVDELK